MAKKKDLDLYNFDFGTVKYEDNQLKIRISKDQFTNKKIEEITVHETDKDPLFLKRDRVVEENDYYTFIFIKSLPSLKPLTKVKNEEYPVKLSIAKQILKDDIITKYQKDNLYISVNPSTLMYYPMKTIQYTYAGNQFMPRTQHTALERYKAVVTSVLTDIPYAKCLTQPKDVSKQTNALVKEIYAKNSRSELLAFLDDSANYITYDYMQNRQAEKNTWKKRLYVSLAGVGLLAILGISFVFAYSANQQKVLAQSYETQISQKDTTIQAEQAFQNGEYEKAIQLFDEAKVDKGELADRLVKEEQYQLAINVDESKVEAVTQHAYDNDKVAELNDLDGSQLSEGAKTKLADEQAIAKKDKNAMTNVLNFLNDENTAERLAKAFVEINDLNSAKQVSEKYPDNKQIIITVQIGEAEQQIKELEEDKEATNDNKQKDEIQKQIDDKQKEIDSLNQNRE